MDSSKITKKLSGQQLKVLAEKGTEAPFSGEHLYRDEDGTYSCSACGNELFSSHTKFEAHCGWPSFYDVASNQAVKLVEDNTHGMRRIEAVCSNCGGHLGHVFNDSPDQPTGLRYCINSLSIDFLPEKQA